MGYDSRMLVAFIVPLTGFFVASVIFVLEMVKFTNANVIINLSALNMFLTIKRFRILKYMISIRKWNSG